MAHYGRGGYYKKSARTNARGDTRTFGSRAPGQAATDANADDDNDKDNDNDNENNTLPYPEDDGEMTQPRDTTQDKGKGLDVGTPQEDLEQRETPVEAPAPLEEVQIMELHSHHPIISYRGRVFEGEWAEVIGTEAIFARRDDNNPLPALRNLNDDVDFLAASASKILTKEKVLKPKISSHDELADIREEWNMRIPVGRDRTGERAHQARFLENLMALKKKKGETDLVTAHARSGDGIDFKDNQAPNARPRQRKRPHAEAPSEGRTRERGRTSGRGGRGEARGRGGSSKTSRSAAATTSLSTPTPARWEELARPRGATSDDDSGSESDEGPLATGKPKRLHTRDEGPDDGNEDEDVRMTG